MAEPTKPSDDYKEGVNDSKKGAIETVFIDTTVNHPDTDDYYDGRDGKEPSSDEKSDKK